MVSFKSSLVSSTFVLAYASATNLRVARTGSGIESRHLLENDGWLCSTFSVPLICNNEGPQCPHVSPLNATQFSLDAYIEKSWFIQKQQVNPYQSENQLYCIVATYNKTDESSEFLEVKNYGNNGGVNGPPQNPDDNGSFFNLCAKQIDGGELSVAPCFFGPAFDLAAGPYWVLAVADDYSWAIVSGGQPDQPRDSNATLCTTKEGEGFLDTNGSGLWLFTRERVASSDTIELMEGTLLELGIYTGDLKNVTQEGCNYEGATLKE